MLLVFDAPWFCVCVFTALQDVASLTTYFQNTCGISPEEKQLSVSGKNWGEVDLNGWQMFSLHEFTSFPDFLLLDIRVFSCVNEL